MKYRGSCWSEVVVDNTSATTAYSALDVVGDPIMVPGTAQGSYGSVVYYEVVDAEGHLSTARLFFSTAEVGFLECQNNAQFRINMEHELDDLVGSVPIVVGGPFSPFTSLDMFTPDGELVRDISWHGKHSTIPIPFRGDTLWCSLRTEVGSHAYEEPDSVRVRFGVESFA